MQCEARAVEVTEERAQPHERGDGVGEDDRSPGREACSQQQQQVRVLLVVHARQLRLLQIARDELRPREVDNLEGVVEDDRAHHRVHRPAAGAAARGRLVLGQTLRIRFARLRRKHQRRAEQEGLSTRWCRSGERRGVVGMAKRFVSKLGV